MQETMNLRQALPVTEAFCSLIHELLLSEIRRSYEKEFFSESKFADNAALQKLSERCYNDKSSSILQSFHR